MYFHNVRGREGLMMVDNIRGLELSGFTPDEKCDITVYNSKVKNLDGANSRVELRACEGIADEEGNNASVKCGEIYCEDCSDFDASNDNGIKIKDIIDVDLKIYKEDIKRLEAKQELSEGEQDRLNHSKERLQKLEAGNGNKNVNIIGQ